MITIDQIEQYSEMLVNDIDALNKLQPVLSIDHMTADLSNIKRSDNSLLYVVIPEYDDDIKDEDSVASFSTIDWFVMDKLREQDGRSAFLESFKNTQAACQEIRAHIFRTARGDGDWDCGGWLREIFKGGSLSIVPVSHKAQLNGWHITLTLRTFR